MPKTETPKDAPDVPVAEVRDETVQGRKPGTYVVYAGRPTTLRLITSAEWAGAGVRDHPDTMWGPENDWTIAKEDLGLNEEQYARIIGLDFNLHEFEVRAEG